MQQARNDNVESSWVARLPFFHGWVILGAAGLGMFMSGPGQTFGVSAFVDPIMQDRGWSRTLVSGLYTAGSLTAATGMILVGRLLDRFGARVMLTAVAVLFGMAAIGMGRVYLPLHLYLGFLAIRMLGQGSLSMIPTTLVAIWFRRLRGRATAMAALAMPASQATFPPLIFFLVSTIGWRNAWTVLGLMIWGALIPLALLVRRSPESVGLLPDGASESPDPAAGALSWGPPEPVFTLGQALGTRSFWLLLFAGSSFSLIGTALTFHHISLMASRGIEGGLAATVLSIAAPSAMAGTFVAGYMADKMPSRYGVVVSQILLTVSMVLALTITTTWTAIVYGVTIGFGQGLMMTSMVVIWPNYYGRAHLGIIRGAVTTGMVAFAALGPLPFGFLFDLRGSYVLPVVAFLALPIACGAAAFLAAPPKPPSLHRDSA
jgi:MFS family permease